MRTTGPVLLLLGSAGCCSRAALDRANQERDRLQAAVVQDYDPAAPDAASCGDLPQVTIDEMRRGVHRNEVVAVDGVPIGGGEMVCTEALCTDPCGHRLPCCNSCGSDLTLLVSGDRHATITLKGPGLSCGGYECAMQCQPFGRNPGRTYRFVGRYTSGTNPNGYPWVSFTADRWCHVP